MLKDKPLAWYVKSGWLFWQNLMSSQFHLTHSQLGKLRWPKKHVFAAVLIVLVNYVWRWHKPMYRHTSSNLYSQFLTHFQLGKLRRPKNQPLCFCSVIVLVMYEGGINQSHIKHLLIYTVDFLVLSSKEKGSNPKLRMNLGPWNWDDFTFCQNNHPVFTVFSWCF